MRSMGRRIGSTTLEATASDSRNDVITASAVLLCTMIARLTGLDLDGYVGAAVAVFILVSGVSLIKETLNPLLGNAPSPELVARIREKLMSYPGVLGVHDSDDPRLWAGAAVRQRACGDVRKAGPD